MKQLYNDDDYVANYYEDDDYLEVIKIHDCIIGYMELRPGIDIALCGSDVLQLKIKDISYGFSYGIVNDVYNKILDIVTNESTIKNITVLRKLTKIAIDCMDVQYNEV